MRTRKQLAAAGLLLIAGAVAACAQVSSPEALIPKPPANPARDAQAMAQRAEQRADLQWLWTFTRPAPGGRASDLRVDARFQQFLHDHFRQPQSMWGPEGEHEPLATVVPLFVSRYGAVNSEDNRYITVDGCVPSFCAAAGLLWIDLGRTQPLAIFAAVNWSTEGRSVDDPRSDNNLWLFTDRDLAPDAIPFALTQAIAHWDARLAAAHRRVPHIAHALLVEPNGSPIALDPAQIGANTLAPQPDTVTPRNADQ